MANRKGLPSGHIVKLAAMGDRAVHGRAPVVACTSRFFCAPRSRCASFPRWPSSSRSRCAARRICIKWPNDVVLVGGTLPQTNAPSIKNLYSKLAGISSEVHAGGICVGIGVNVEPPEGAMEVDGKNAPAYLADLGFGFTCEREAAINAVGDAVLHEFEPLYRRWCDGGFAALSGEFAEHSMLEGRFVRMANQLGEVVCEGTVRGVDASGRLILRLEDGEAKAVASGEVHLL